MLQLLDILDGDAHGRASRDVADRGGENIRGIGQLFEQCGILATLFSRLIRPPSFSLFFDQPVNRALANLASEFDDADAIEEWKGVSVS
jgi:hypothetical protein